MSSKTHRSTNIISIFFEYVSFWQLPVIGIFSLTPALFFHYISRIEDSEFIIYFSIITLIISICIWFYGVLHFAKKEKRRRILTSDFEAIPIGLKGMVDSGEELYDFPRIDGKLKNYISYLQNEAPIEGNTLPLVEGIEDYARKKEELILLREQFMDSIIEDLKTPDISLNRLLVITESIKTISKYLEELTDMLLGLMPENAAHIYVYPDPDLYREMLFEENSWIEHTAQNSLIVLDTWNTSHKEELKGEKEKLQNLIELQNTHIHELLLAANFIERNVPEKIRI